jgi:hypothetical protein
MTSQSGSFVFRILFGLVIAWFADVSNAQEVGTPAAPPRKCEVRQAAWCIDQGAWEITDRFIKHDKYDHAWTVRGFFRPKAPLVVLEPSGCRDGFSDSLSAIRFDLRYAWDGKTWNRMVVRLRHDGSCDLDVLIPNMRTILPRKRSSPAWPCCGTASVTIAVAKHSMRSHPNGTPTIGAGKRPRHGILHAGGLLHRIRVPGARSIQLADAY